MKNTLCALILTLTATQVFANSQLMTVKTVVPEQLNISYITEIETIQEGISVKASEGSCLIPRELIPAGMIDQDIREMIKRVDAMLECHIDSEGNVNKIYLNVGYPSDGTFHQVLHLIR